MTEDDMLVFFKLSKAGYGSVNEIQNWNARLVLQCLHYEHFCSQYENALHILNSKD